MIIKGSDTVNPLVTMGATMAAGSIANQMGGRAPKAFKTGMKIMSVPGTIATGVQAIGNAADSYKSAVKDNQYHDKLNKTAAEEDSNEKKEKLKTKILKATPYAAIGAALLTYGSQALKDKSLTKPIKDAGKSIPAEMVNQLKKKNKVLKGVVKGAKDSVKKGNTIIINKNGKQSLFNRMAQGAAFGTGALGVHLLGDKYFKNKELTRKSYDAAQPGMVKALKKGGKIMADIKKRKEEDEEKTASLKSVGAKVLDTAKDIKINHWDAPKAGNINWKNVYQKGVLDAAATAIPIYLAKEIAGQIRRPAQEAARRKADTEYYNKIRKKREERDGEEKTASFKNVGAKVLDATQKNATKVLDATKKNATKFHNKYGEDIATQAAKIVTGTAATVPVMLGMEYLKEKAKNRKKEKEYEERAHRREANNYQRRDNNGRNYKGGKKYYNIKSDLSIPEKGRVSENGGAVRD